MSASLEGRVAWIAAFELHEVEIRGRRQPLVVRAVRHGDMLPTPAIE